MKIAVLSIGPGNYTTKRLKQAIRERGHEAVRISYKRAYMKIESNRPSVHIDGQSIQGIDAVIPRIAASYTSYGAAVVRQFEMQRVYSSVSSLALVRSRDKLRSMQLLARAGIGIPKTVFANQTTDTNDLLELIGGAPAVVKLVSSTHGKGVVLAETKKAAKSVIEAFHSLGANFIVQEFIEEAGGADIRAIVVGDKVVGAMMRQGADGEFRSNLHRGGTSLPIVLTRKEQNLAVKAAKTLGLTISGVDILRSKRGPLILEVNSSPGIQGTERETGFDVAGAIVDYVIEKAGGKHRKDRIGA